MNAASLRARVQDARDIAAILKQHIEAILRDAQIGRDVARATRTEFSTSADWDAAIIELGVAHRNGGKGSAQAARHLVDSLDDAISCFTAVEVGDEMANEPEEAVMAEIERRVAGSGR